MDNVLIVIVWLWFQIVVERFEFFEAVVYDVLIRSKCIPHMQQLQFEIQQAVLVDSNKL